MANKKQINSRIQLKHDYEAHWNKAADNGFIPMAGEIIVYNAEVGSDSQPIKLTIDGVEKTAYEHCGRTAPYTYARQKIGDGIHTIRDIPFVDEPLKIQVTFDEDGQCILDPNSTITHSELWNALNDDRNVEVVVNMSEDIFGLSASFHSDSICVSSKDEIKKYTFCGHYHVDNQFIGNSLLAELLELSEEMADGSWSLVVTESSLDFITYSRMSEVNVHFITDLNFTSITRAWASYSRGGSSYNDIPAIINLLKVARRWSMPINAFLEPQENPDSETPVLSIANTGHMTTVLFDGAAFFFKIRDLEYRVNVTNDGYQITPFHYIMEEEVRGDGEKSLIMNDLENNIARSAYSQASGYNTQAGMKGYYWNRIILGEGNKTATIELSKEQPQNGSAIENVEAFDTNLAVGNIISIVSGSKFTNCAKITDINRNTITVESYPDPNVELSFKSKANYYAPAGDAGVDDSTFFVVANPDVGEVPLGHYANANGENTIALERASYSEGRGSKAIGQYSHAEGRDTEAWYASHAEGRQTLAQGDASHAEGYGAKAIGGNSHAEGKNTQAIGAQSHAEGISTIAEGVYGAHAEGYKTTAKGQSSHSEGVNTIAEGINSHAEGAGTQAIGAQSHSEGMGGTKAIGEGSHAEGKGVEANGNYSHAEGNETWAEGEGSHAEGNFTHANGEASHAEGHNVIADGQYSHAEGTDTQANGNYSHAEGNATMASGVGAHTEGGYTGASGEYAHAEGCNTHAYGDYSHTEGTSTTAISKHSYAGGYENTAGMRGYYWSYIDIPNKIIYLSRTQPTAKPTAGVYDPNFNSGYFVYGAEENIYRNWASLVNGSKYTNFGKITNVDGNKITVDNLPFTALAAHSDGVDDYTFFILEQQTEAGVSLGQAAHVEGEENIAYERSSHAEGRQNKAVGQYSHVEGRSNEAWYAAHAEGRNNKALADYAHAEGKDNKVEGLAAHVEGIGNTLTKTAGYSHAEGYGHTIVAGHAHAEGWQNTVGDINQNGEVGKGAHAEGLNNNITGQYAHVEGTGNNVSGKYAHAEGSGNTASQICAHSEGNGTTASGESAHSEGYATSASGNYSHSEGKSTQAEGQSGHAEGEYTEAKNQASHAEGYKSQAVGAVSHAEGYGTQAKGYASHAGGMNTIASIQAQTVVGRCNAEDPNALFIVGNGTVGEDGSVQSRSNGFTVNSNGTATVSANPINDMDVANKAYVDDCIAANPGPKGDSISITNISQSTTAGGTSIVTFSDGNTLSIKNGFNGAKPVKGIDYFTETDIEAMVEEVLSRIPLYYGAITIS